MIDEIAFRVLFELGKLAVAGLSSLAQLAVKGVSSLVSSNESTAAETQELSPEQTKALVKLNELQKNERKETRILLLKELEEKKVLDATSIETLEQAKKAAEIQAAQARQVQTEFFNASAPLLLPARSLSQSLLHQGETSPKIKIPQDPYFNALRAFDEQMKPFKKKTNTLVSSIKTAGSTLENVCGEIGKNLRALETQLETVKPEPENLFLDFFYFLSEIPKPPSLFELNQEFLKTTNVSAIAQAFEEVSNSTAENREGKLNRLGGLLGAQIQQVLGTLFRPEQVAPLSTAVENLFKNPFSRRPDGDVEPTKKELENGNGPASGNTGPRNK